MIIRWREAYSCHNPTIDKQHKKMMDLINQMSEIVELNDDADHYDEIMEIFNELKAYVSCHFSYEEKMFKETGYDSFNTKIQVHEHQSFILKVAAVNLYELDENQIETARNMLDFLSRWLDHHILLIDKKFGSFLEENTI